MGSAKRLIALLLTLIMLLSVLTGCSTLSEGMDSNDDNTLKLIIAPTNIENVLHPLQEKFPDINFDVEFYTGLNFSRYSKEELIRGDAGDIFFYTTFFDSDEAGKYLVDLSGYPFLANFDRSILSTLDVDGAIYQIPGAILVRYVAVNKTMFEENGWKIPRNFDELVAVCKQIREEKPDIVPIGMGMAGLGYVFSLVTSYAQLGYLDTAAGKQAMQDFLDGKGSFGDAFGEGLDMVAELIDAGAFEPEMFKSVWDAQPEQLLSRNVAMAFLMGPGQMHSSLVGGEFHGNEEYGEYCNDEFVALPMFGRNATNKGLILGSSNTWGINKRLEEKGNEKKLENALRVLEYISTEEGQLATRTNNSAIPCTKDIESDNILEFIRELWNDPTNSIKTFFLYTGYEHIMVETAQLVVDAMEAKSSEGMKEKVVKLADELNDSLLKGEISSETYGVLEDDLSVEQTRRLCCNVFRDAAAADFALASECEIIDEHIDRAGLSGKLFKGNVISESLAVIVSVKNQTIATVSLTGKEVRELLDNGKVLTKDNGETVSLRYWTNCAELDDNASYTVAMILGDYNEDFASTHEIKDTGIVLADAIADYFREVGTLKASDIS